MNRHEDLTKQHPREEKKEPCPVLHPKQCDGTSGVRRKHPFTDWRKLSHRSGLHDLTIEYTDRHIPVSIFSTNAAILFAFPALVKIHRDRLLAIITGLIIPIWQTSIIPLWPHRIQADTESVHRASDSPAAAVQNMGDTLFSGMKRPNPTRYHLCCACLNLNSRAIRPISPSAPERQDSPVEVHWLRFPL